MPAERPIMFTAEMVRAILDGRKTETRRVYAPWGREYPGQQRHPNDGKDVRCPYGKPGDLLWVKETHRDARDAGAGRVLWCADGDVACGWTSPIFMPKALARIWLRNEGVRIERVQDITGPAVLREGLAFEPGTSFGTMRHDFAVLWDSINAKRGFGWDANPWVRVVRFSVASTTGRPDVG